MKERITLTIEKDILQQVDSQVDGRRIKNRSHAMELLLLTALGSTRPQKALILAGGKGTHLRPITEEIPKPLIPIQGKPLLEHVIDLFKRAGIQDILISVGYKSDKIKEAMGDGRHLGVRITYIEETQPLGTGGPLRLAKPFLTNTFFMCNADELKDLDLNAMYLFHKESGAMGTLALTTVQDPSSYGVARLNGSKILEFIEKPRKGNAPSNLINAGLYILEPEVIDLIPSSGAVSLERDVFPQIAAQGKLFGYPFSGQWFDTGTLDRYEKAIKGWKGIR